MLFAWYANSFTFVSMSKSCNASFKSWANEPNIWNFLLRCKIFDRIAILLKLLVTKSFCPVTSRKCFWFFSKGKNPQGNWRVTGIVRSGYCFIFWTLRSFCETAVVELCHEYGWEMRRILRRISSRTCNAATQCHRSYTASTRYKRC